MIPENFFKHTVVVDFLLVIQWLKRPTLQTLYRILRLHQSLKVHVQIIVFVCCCHGCIGMDFPILEDREEI